LKQYVIAGKGERYWSLYGWAPLLNALRFSAESDAQEFRADHGLSEAEVLSITFDDERRPDIATDYNPFGL
jgi:hypothetical protein